MSTTGLFFIGLAIIGGAFIVVHALRVELRRRRNLKNFDSGRPLERTSEWD
jgi:hypothetical protein